MQRFERHYIAESIRACNGNVEATAKILGIHRSGLYKKLRDYQILTKTKHE